MADDILKKDWNKLKGKIKNQWHALNDDDLKRIDGNRDVLQAILQEKYTYSAYNAEMEVNRFINQVTYQPQRG